MSRWTRLLGFLFFAGLFAGVAGPDQLLNWRHSSQDPLLAKAAQQALRDLQKMGFGLKSPVSLFSFAAGQAPPQMDLHGKAGLWRPGRVWLREEGLSSETRMRYLRHELFHEAQWQNCPPESIPPWYAELQAMAFSGESALLPIPPELRRSLPQPLGLAHRLKENLPLDASDRSWLLSQKKSDEDFLVAPCHMSPLPPLAEDKNASKGFSGAIWHFDTLRVWRQVGTAPLTAIAPPGSLLKIPVLAALKNPTPAQQKAFLASQTEELVEVFEKGQLDENRWRALAASWLPSSDLDWLLSGGAPLNLRRMALGERRSEGEAPTQFSLIELAQLLRMSTLMAPPKRMDFLKDNGLGEGSTLEKATEGLKKWMQTHRAWAKTGTASTGVGVPLWGHVAFVWPLEKPTFLAIFRAEGTSSRKTAEMALPYLMAFTENWPAPENTTVSVKLLSAVTHSPNWKLEREVPKQPSCPPWKLPSGEWTSWCGSLSLHTDVQNARLDRLVRGRLRADKKGWPILTTDIASWREGVEMAEAQGLPRAAQVAFGAVVYFNGQSWNTHKKGPLCDSTLCMVFLGEGLPLRHGPPLASEWLLALQLSRSPILKKWQWFPYSSGGDTPWRRTLPKSLWQNAFQGGPWWEAHRQAASPEMVLLSATGTLKIPCEVFRATLKLPSCPSRVTTTTDGQLLVEGQGAGHGFGLDLNAAAEAARAGATAENLLEEALEKLPLGGFVSR